MRKLEVLGSALLFGLAAAADGQTDVMRVFLPHPDAPARHVEILVARPAGAGPWPALLYVHGHQDGPRPGAKVFADSGQLSRMAGRGLLAAAVSQPGYGLSDGPPDYCGPFWHAVEAALAWLRHHPSVDAERVGLFGYSRGAVVGAMVATRDTKLRAVILGGGAYDLRDAYRRMTNAGMRKNVEHEMGTSDAAFAARSALPLASRIRAPVLLMEGSEDEKYPSDQARKFRDAIRAGGGMADLVLFEGIGHAIPPAKQVEVVNPFLEKTLLAKR